MSTVTTHSILSLEDAAAEQLAAQPDREVVRIQLQRELEIGAFAASVHRAEQPGGLIAEHDESEPALDGHEKLFFVASGRATFTIDGEEIDAPAGTVLFVRDPAARRSAVAQEAGTTLFVAGGRRGEAFRRPPGDAIREFWPLYEAKDYEGADSVLREALEEFPGNALVHYNLACIAALTGRSEDAIANLRGAVEGHAKLAENARDDSDLDSVRSDPRFAELVQLG